MKPAFFLFKMSKTQLFIDIISGHAKSPLAYFSRLLLSILSCGYALITSLRNLAFDIGLKTTVKATVPVVSIGNITTGGTGKTPMVEYVCRYFRDRGLRVAILSRGYGTADHGGMNDEGLLLYQNLPDVPHLQDADRVSLASIAVEELESQVLVLDDALQHRRIARDLNIVLIDATNPFGFGWLLPRGLLREPSSQSLSRADAIIITRSDLVTSAELASIQNRIFRKVRPGTPVALSVHQPTDILLATGEVQQLQVLRGKKAAVFSGLGNPIAFLKTIEQLGVQVVDEKVFPDHYRYTEKDIAELSQWVVSSGADLALTSQKDLVKLVSDHLGGLTVAAVRIGLQINHARIEIDKLLDRIANQAEESVDLPIDCDSVC